MLSDAKVHTGSHSNHKILVQFAKQVIIFPFILHTHKKKGFIPA